MIGKVHTRPRATVRFALIVTYLALFATQLSYKYYRCTSYPWYFSRQHQASSLQTSGSLIPGVNSIRILSLDKRFDDKCNHARLSPVIAVTALRPVPKVFVHEPVPGLPALLPPAPQQRGPPFAA